MIPSVREEYQRKLMTAEEAVRLIRSGDRVYIGSNCGQPVAVSEALVRRRKELHGVEIVHLLTMGPAPYVDLQYEENFRHMAYFIGANVRKAVQNGQVDYCPIFLSEIPELFLSGQTPIDVAMISVSPPDAHGFVSMGVSVDIGWAACKVAKRIIAEVNDQMPRTLGNSFLHVSDITAFVEASYPVLEHPAPPPDEISTEIGRHIVPLIEDGATIQTGIGGIPSAVLSQIGDKNDLGVHTEMFSDTLIDVILAGNVTCRKKTVHPNKVVATFIIGTKMMYDFVDNNPFFEFVPTQYANDPFVVARNDKMVAINGAIEVDLTGQVCSDSIGHKFFSGIGGQVDFIRGAARSKGGRPIIALPSTTSDGKISRITPVLKPGAGVVTSRGDVHYVVTEYGMAYLHGRSVRERCLSLIRIAHPKFRDELLEKAKELGYLPDAQPSLEHNYPSDYVQEVELEADRKLTIRPIKPTDEQLLKRHFYNLRPEAVHHRFHRMVNALSNATVRDLVNVDYRRHFALVATVQEGKGEEIVATTRFYVDEARGTAEIAFAVLDEWQNKGLGRVLLEQMIRRARELKVQTFEAYVHSDNAAMLRLFQTSGAPVELKLEENQYLVRLDLSKE